MNRTIELTPERVTRFWAKVDRCGPDECWLWTTRGGVVRSPWAWLLDVLLGPRCQMPDCNYRARGPRSLIAHYWGHAGDPS